MPPELVPRPPVGALLRIRNGALAGVGVALLGVAIGLGRALLSRSTGNRVSFPGFFPVVLWYATGFALGGALVGFVWPVGSSVLRRRLIFVAGMSIVVGAIAILESGSPLTWHRFDWLLWAGLSVLFGLALSVGYERT
jgi:hypothetical protein